MGCGSYELVLNTFLKAGEMKPPSKTNFYGDVLPILSRLAQLGWLNQGFAAAFGPSEKPKFDFTIPGALEELAHALPSERAEIKKIYDSFRLSTLDPAEIKDRKLWPMLYGDAYGTFDKSLNENLIVPDLQTIHLNRWKANTAEYDSDTPVEIQATIEEVDLQKQPHMLDKAAMHFCLADAFHPGCELTWPMRNISIYKRGPDGKHMPFRINPRSEADIAKEAAGAAPYGTQESFLTHESVLREGGPLYQQGPGDLTKWMALPWQGDTVFCRSGYEPEFDPYIPAFWPARVPNHVLTEDSYRMITDTSVPKDKRLAELRKNRQSWVRNMTGEPAEQMTQMVRDFGNMGIIEAQEGIHGDPDFPETMYVETLPSAPSGTRSVKKPPSFHTDHKSKTHEETDLIKKAGWESAEQLKKFRDIRFRHVKPSP